MNVASVFRISEKCTPPVTLEVKEGWSRVDVVSLLNGDKNIGIELGVAKGEFSKLMLESSAFRRFYGVDAYSDVHDTDEYIAALTNVGVEEVQYSLIRSNFASALDLFPDEYFDFIYIDGFAHTGEEGGKTLVDWYPKLKVGGVFAGDDYHQDWPLVVWAVNDFAIKVGCVLSVTSVNGTSNYSRYPTWYIQKSSRVENLSVDRALYRIAKREERRLRMLRVGLLGRYFVQPVRRIFFGLGLKIIWKALSAICRRIL